MNKRSFFIVGKHAVLEALKNPSRKVLRVFLTEESKKNIHRESQKQNLLKDIKVYFRNNKIKYYLNSSGDETLKFLGKEVKKITVYKPNTTTTR